MIEKDKFEKIKKLHSEYASWAIWADQGEKPKSNIGDLSVLDPKKNNQLLTTLKPEIIFVALNFSRGGVIKKPFANFHDSNPRGTDFKIRYALKDTPYWGGYMTDIIKNFVELKSKNLMKHLQKNKDFEKKNIEFFLKELDDLEAKNPIIIAFGNDTYDIINRNINKFKILKVPHYAIHKSKEEYREEVKNILVY